MEEMLELIDKLNKWSFEYYALDNPSVADKEYDKEYDKLVKLEKIYGIQPNSPTTRVGDVVLDCFAKVNHTKKLWSLDKAQSFDELKDWMDRCERFVNNWNATHDADNQLPALQYILTKKFDGLTIKSHFVDGQDTLVFKQGSTRGTGFIGEDVTEQCKTILNMPKVLSNENNISFIDAHGECLMTHKALEEYNNNIADGVTAKPLKNCRNGIAGAIRNLDSKETAKRKPIIYFYNINDIDADVELTTYTEQLEYMKSLKLPVAEYTVCNTFEEVVAGINTIEEHRFDLPYDIDGAVIAVDDLKTRELMGFGEKFPKYSLAYKYAPQETTTILLGVEWNVGRTGKVTPKAILKPVEIMGSTITKATLNNVGDIKRKGVKINAEVFIRKSNDVIPEITGVVEDSLNNPAVKDIEIPVLCPNCGSKLINKNDVLYCYNTECGDKNIKHLEHYCTREAMNIEGLSIKSIEKFVECGFFNKITDIYTLESHKEEVLKLEGFGEKSWDKLMFAIDKSKKCKLHAFIYALGIPNVGKQTAKQIVEFLKDKLKDDAFPSNYFYTMWSLSVEDWLNMPDCGDVLSQTLYDYIHDKDNTDMIVSLINNVLDIQPEVETPTVDAVDNPLKGKHVYPTGGFNFKKTQVKEQLEALGAVVENGLKKSLDYLICGSDMSKSNKDTKANDLNAKGANIKIITEDDLMNIIQTVNK